MRKFENLQIYVDYQRVKAKGEPIELYDLTVTSVHAKTEFKTLRPSELNTVLKAFDILEKKRFQD